MAKILAPTPLNLNTTSECLREGGIVGMPTETVYGLAADAFNETALARVFAVKERPTFDPLIVHVSARFMTRDPLEALHEQQLIDLTVLSPLARTRASALMIKFWPGPLTVVLPKNPRVPDLATSGLNTVGLRMPRHPVAQALIDAAGTALAAPSANRFGRISPTLAAHVDAELGDRIEYILDGGPCEVGLESTVVAVQANGELRLLRPGAVSVEQLEATIGTTVSLGTRPDTGLSGMASPGMLESHYAPSKPLRLLPEPVLALTPQAAQALALVSGSRLGLLLMSGNAEELGRKFEQLTGCQVFALSLSRKGNLEEAARNLFAALRSLDQSVATLLFAEPCTATAGLGYAIADRLMRAAARS